MAVQARNDELVDLLTPDFPRRNDPHGFWHGHSMIAPAGVALVIPDDFAVVVPWFEIEAGASLEIQGDGVLQLTG